MFESTERKEDDGQPRRKILGYLNLLANCIDNFLHGLTVASRWVSEREFRVSLSAQRFMYVQTKLD